MNFTKFTIKFLNMLQSLLQMGGTPWVKEFFHMCPRSQSEFSMDYFRTVANWYRAQRNLSWVDNTVMIINGIFAWAQAFHNTLLIWVASGICPPAFSTYSQLFIVQTFAILFRIPFWNFRPLAKKMISCELVKVPWRYFLIKIM